MGKALEVIKALVDANRWRYLLRSILGQFSSKRLRCPYCERQDYELVKRKKVATALVRCSGCKLLYRIPTDTPAFNSTFYQDDYKAGFTTDCPSPQELERLLSSGFMGSPMEMTGRVAVLKAVGVEAGARVFDFGSSWGYGSWQLQHAGYEVQGYEISRPRARYARELLHVPVEDEVSRIAGSFDVFFSSHVLEHLPSPRIAFDLARRLMKPGGLFIAFTPNGSFEFLRACPEEYHTYWSIVHPLYLDDLFYRNTFPDRVKLLCSTPYGTAYDLEQISRWDRSTDLTFGLTKSELCFAYAN